MSGGSYSIRAVEQSSYSSVCVTASISAATPNRLLFSTQCRVLVCLIQCLGLLLKHSAPSNPAAATCSAQHPENQHQQNYRHHHPCHIAHETR